MFFALSGFPIILFAFINNVENLINFSASTIFFSSNLYSVFILFNKISVIVLLIVFSSISTHTLKPLSKFHLVNHLEISL